MNLIPGRKAGDLFSYWSLSVPPKEESSTDSPNRSLVEAATGIVRRGYTFLEGIAHTIQFLSDACGFANVNYSARVFRNSVDVNPHEYARADREMSLPTSEEDRVYVL